MPTVHTLPENPDLGQLRLQARTLQRAVHAGDAGAIARVLARHPDGVPEDPSALTLATAQLVIAREYGFASWPRLRHYLTVVEQHGWDSPRARSAAGDPADEFCRLACLSYQEDDGPDRWERARRLLAERPGLTDNHVWAAAAAAEPATVGRLLAGDAGLARRRGGPYRWAPLCYLAYSRFDLTVPAEPVLTVARLLLDADADPGEGYLWAGRPYPFTLLTGVFGEGELGPVHQPRHPHAPALARLLLDAGAEPNDSQALYNRMFRPDNEHLELLLQYGLGTGDGGPWRARLGELIDSPPELLRVQLRWAVEHGYLDRVRLLVHYRVDFRTPYRGGDGPQWLPDDGRTPAELAALNGHPVIVDFLVSQGAAAPALDPPDELIAAALRGDREEALRLRETHPQAAAGARRANPGLPVWAAANGRYEAAALLVELGFDVNARGRGDTPAPGEWETALHHAAARGDLDLARRLLGLGADPSIRDARFGATPRDWARHFGQLAMAEFLEAPARGR